MIPTSLNRSRMRLLADCTPADIREESVRHALQELRSSGLVTGEDELSLSAAYEEKIEGAKARLELAHDQFMASLEGRLNEEAALAPDSRRIVVDVTAGFLDRLCRERGLGVAQNLAQTDREQITRRTASLLQELPDQLASCETRDQALRVVGLTADILAHPRDVEASFLGLLSQAYFGQHLVGVSEAVARIDVGLISSTCYILDASFLVCLLADGAESNRFATSLVSDLVQVGATLVTTDLFCEEVAEHAQWAVRCVHKRGDRPEAIMDVLQGRNGYRSNQFLQGFYLGEIGDNSFKSYMSRLFGRLHGNTITAADVAEVLRDRGVEAVRFDEWVGFDPSLFVLRDEVEAEIAFRRKTHDTYRHGRQTRAEAEVAICVDRIRAHAISPPGAEPRDAFFVSSTRVVDGLKGLCHRISLLPEGLAQWLWAVNSASQRHADLVFEQLLWELAESGIEFVDRATLLRKFSGVVEASDAELKALVRDRREYLVEKYGSDPADAFSDVDPLDIPRLLAEAQKEALAQLGQALDASRQREVEARATARVTEKERAELEKWKVEKAERKRKAKKRKGAAASVNSKKGRKKKRHKK